MTEVKGSIHVKVGCMFAGKSTYLLQQYHKYSRKYPTIIIKYDNDNRYSKIGIGTHDKIIHTQNVIVSGKNIQDILPQTKQYRVICVEEGQFYVGLVKFCEILANAGKLVIVVGLDSDVNRDGFGEIPLLLPKSEKFEKIHAVCNIKDCHNEASFTSFTKTETKLGNEKELIGGDEIYQAVCRKHY